MQNLFASFLHTVFKLNRIDFDRMLKYFRLNILILLLIEIYKMKRSNCYFTDCVKKPFNVDLHVDVL